MFVTNKKIFRNGLKMSMLQIADQCRGGKVSEHKGILNLKQRQARCALKIALGENVKGGSMIAIGLKKNQRDFVYSRWFLVFTRRSH